MAFLESIRSSDKRIPPGKMVFNTIAVLLLGVVLGVFSKYLDYHQGDLPHLLMLIDETLDLHNFLGRFPFWVVMAVCLSVGSNSAPRAAVNVFAFFVGMVSSYYGYSYWIAGFFPRSYAMIWAAFTIISPLLAFICWYAKGKGALSLVLSAVIIAALFNMTFSYGWGYFDLRSVLELLALLCGLVVLKRSTIIGTVVMAVLGAGIAPIVNAVLPYQFRLW